MARILPSGKLSLLNLRRLATAAFLCAFLLIAPTAGAWEMAAGQVALPATSVGSGFQSVTFSSPFATAPLVFAMPTMEGAVPTTVRVRNVTPLGFELVQVEAPAADGPHEAMTVDWVAVTPGSHTLPDGTTIEVGTASVNSIQHGSGLTDTESWHALTFLSSFAATPAVLLQLQTDTNESATVPEQASQPWLVVGVANVSLTGANIALERCEAAPGVVVSAETVAYLASDAGAAGSFSDAAAATILYETAITTDSIRGVDNGCYSTSFASTFSATPLLIGHMNRHDGGDGGWLRRCSVDAAGVAFTVDEDTHRDTERAHTPEAAGFIAFSAPFFATFGGAPVTPTISFDSASFSVNEDAATHNLSVSLSELAGSDVTIDFATANGSATAGSDYTSSSGQLTIIAGQLSGQIPIDILADTIFEGDEDFTVTLTNPQGATAGSNMASTGTILDDETVPQVFFSANDYIVDEAIGAVDLDISLSHASAVATSVDWTVTDVTTTQGSDYSEPGGTIDIPALAISANLSITILDDGDDEGDETAQLDLATPVGLALGTPATATLTITDNDSPAASWAMTAGTLTLPSTIDGSSFQTIAFDQAFAEVPLVFAMPGSEGIDPASIRIRDITATGFDAAQVESPNADGDHEAITMNWIAVTPGEHTLPDGTLLEAGSLTTSAVQFGSGVTGTESWESVSFATTFSAAPAVLAQIQTMTNETAAVPGEASTPWLVVAMSNVSPTAVNLALERAEVAAGTVSSPETIAYLAVDAGAADSFVAIDASPVDYETFVTPDALTGWGNNNCVATGFVNTYATNPLPIGHQNRHDGGDGGWLRMCSLSTTDVGFWIDEDQYANDERNHTNEAGGAIIFSRPFHAVFGGQPPAPTIQFELSADSVSEGAGSITLNVELSAVASGDVTVDYQSADVSATAGSDYTTVSNTLTIVQGQTTGSIVVPILDDGDDEPDETFTVTLTNPVGADPGTTMATTVTITDDDLPPLPEVGFASSTATVAEDGASVSLDVTLTAAAATDVTVDYQSADGSATAGADYTAVNDTLTILQGQTTGSIVVPILDDGEDEPDETFTVTLSNPVGADPGAVLVATVTITDDDLPPLPEIQFASSTATVAEDGGSVSLGVTLSAIAPTDVTIDYQSADVSATAGSDYTTVNNTLTIVQGQTTGSIVVPILDDVDDEPNETFTVTLTNPVGADPGATLVATVTITDNDAAGPATTVVYSVGETNDQLAGGGSFMSLTGGIATFSGETWFFPPSVGSRITYDTDSKVVFVRSCTDPLTCEVTLANGAIPADGPSVELTELRNEFASLSAAMVGAGDALHLDAYDLVAAGIDLEIVCQSGYNADTTAVDISGWNTDAEHGITIRTSPDTRHAGAWSDTSYRLEVTDGSCITSSVGNLRMEGLQLYCTGAPTAGISGIELIGATLDGSVEISETLIRLDDAADTGDRIGVEITNVGAVDLLLRNLVIRDLGSGSDRHVGVLVDDASVNAEILSTTIVGGTHGVRQAAGQTMVINTISSGATSSGFTGSFEPGSANNFSDDATAPGANSITDATPPFVDPVAGATGDYHLECGLPGGALVTHSPFDIGNIDNVFDGNPNILARSAAENPAFVQLEYPNPVTVDWAGVVLSHSGGGHQWMVAMADSAADMASRSGSYREIVGWRDALDSQPSWFEATLPAPESGTVLRLEVVKLLGDDYVHIAEWAVDFIDAPCELGADLTAHAGYPFSIDVDGATRVPPWDIGADEATQPEIFFSQQPNDWYEEIWESEGSVVVEVYLSEPPVADLELAYRTEESSASAGADFTPVEGTVTVPAGRAVARVTVPIIDDGLSDDSEWFDVVFAPSGTSFDLGTPVSVRIYDGQPPVRASLTAETVFVNEDAGQVQLTVQLSEPAPADLTVWWNPNDATAMMGLDYGGQAGAFNLTTGETTGIITIPIVDDAIAEPDEVFRVTLPGALVAQVIAPAVAEVVIIDDDEPTVAFTSPTYSISESSAQATITVQRIGQISGPETVEWATISGGTAASGVDYVASSGVLDFDPLTSSRTIDITIIPDVDSEPDETVLLELSNPSAGLTLGAQSHATLTILDDDRLPEVSFASATADVAETAGTIDLTVVLDRTTDVPVDVQVDTSDGSAFAGSDYSPLSQVLTILANQSSGSVTISIIDDGQPEGDETFDVTLSDPSGATLGDPIIATVTILGDGSVPVVSFSSAAFATDENQGPMVLEVVLDRSPSAAVSVRVRSTDGEALAGPDYTAVDEIVNFGVGETSRTVSVDLNDDALYEHAETFSVALSAPSGAILGLPDSAVATIYQSDWPPFVYLADGGSYTAAYTAFEQLDEIVIPVRLSNSSGVTAEIDYGTSAESATADVDYTEMSGTLIFAPGETEHFIVIPIADDGTADSGETFRITLSAPLDCTLDHLLPDDGVVTIRDDAWVSFPQSEVSTFEDDGDLTVSVTLSSALAQDAYVSYSVTDGTAVDGEDYTAVSGNLLFVAGNTVRYFTVPILADTDLEPDETFTISLSNPSGVPLGDPSTQIVTILDDELPEVAVSQPTWSVAEDGGELSVVVTLTATSTQDVSVGFTTGDASATAGEDYVATTGTLDIIAGQTTGSIPITILDDGDIEGDETFDLTLSNPQGAVIRDGGSTTVAILDDDQVGVEVLPSALQTSEDGGPAVFSIELTSQPSADVTIDLASSDTTEGVVSPTSVTFAPGSWNTPQQITVTPVDDAEIDAAIDYLVETQPAVSADPAYSGLDAPDVTVTNVDDELRPVINKPIEGRYYGDGQVIELDAVASSVPGGYQTWFAVLRDDGSDPMDLVHLAGGLTGSFTASSADPAYRVRLVVATPSAMPADAALRGDAAPCTYGPSQLECASAERVIPYVSGGRVPFELAYAFPDEVMLRFGFETPAVERSSDGGQTWQRVEDYTEWWEEYFFIDTAIEQGVTYHYRIPLTGDDIYLGQTTTPPGQPVEIPVWMAPRIIPQLDDVTWHCPLYTHRRFCDGTLHIRLQAETDQSLSGATIRVFLNEETFEPWDGNGEVMRTDFDTTNGSLHDFRGYDLPGCVVRKPTPDVEVVVPIGEEEYAIDLAGIDFGSNALRFEVEMPNGDISERAILIGVMDTPWQTDYGTSYATFVPVLFGTTIASSDPHIRVAGPVNRQSPDCVDGDSWYYFDHFPDYIKQLFLNEVSFGSFEDRLVSTDETGEWSSVFPGVADGIYPLQMFPPSGAFPNYGSLGREIVRPEGGYFNSDYAPQVYADSYSILADITVDSAYVDLEPSLSHVVDEVLIDAPGPEDVWLVRFRLTDADQDLDMATVRVYNCSIESCEPGQPGTVPHQGFYASMQWGGADGDYGWFMVDIPLSLANDGVNELRFCAEDTAGNPLGTPTDPCVSWNVTRTSPAVFAAISEPATSELDVRPGEIVSVDGSASSFPAGGVAYWTVGDQYSPGFPWVSSTFTPYAGDPSELVTNIHVPTYYSYWRKARLVVAASEADLPADPWPDDGSLPCLRSEGAGLCDSAEFVLDSNCNVEPQLATVVRDLPTGSLYVSPEEPFRLQGHVTSPAYTFAYRWSVYHADDTTMRWPIATLGFDDAGEGFSLANDDLTITATGQGLEIGTYLVKLEARYPASGCETTWFLGSPGAFTLRVGHTLDGVAPGQVVEGAAFRVYSRSWTEGETGWVFIDEDINNPPGELMYSGTVQPGGFVEITPNPVDLPAIGTAWYVSVGTESDGSDRSTWVNALEVMTAGDAVTPNIVTNEEDTSCGGIDTECEHPILPGQTWRGEWDEPGDEDGFVFIAGAGTTVSITLDRVDLTLPPQHPDAPAPEIYLAGPDDVAFAASAPLALDATGAGLDATVTVVGKQTILVRSSKGAGQYLVTLNVTAEGGTGQPAFGFTHERVYLTTEARTDTRLKAALIDPFGNPITGARVSWEQGAICGMGDFCGNGTTTTQRSSVDGFAVLDVAPTAGGDPLWKPTASLDPMLKHRPVDRSEEIRRAARALAERPILGVVRRSNRAILGAELSDPSTAMELKADAKKRALARGDGELKDGPLCPNHSETCPSSGELVFHAAQLALNPGDDLVDVEVRILHSGAPTETLDGHTVLSDIPLTLEIEATVRDDQAVERQVMVTEPAAVVLSEGAGGAVSDGVNSCSKLEIAPGGFTYKNAREAGLHYSHDELDGTPCCWLPTEFIKATVVVDAEADDGQGGAIRVTKRASTVVESIPRPADPCEIRPYPPGTYPGGVAQIAGFGLSNPANDTYVSQWIGSVYTIDACGNISHPSASDPQVSIASFTPADPQLWADLVHDEHDWDWDIMLRSAYCTDPPCDDPDDNLYIPDGTYSVGLTVDRSAECGGGTATYDQTVEYSYQLPIIRLLWEQTGDEPAPPMASPGSALRNSTTGEVIAWRVSPSDGAATYYTDVPVKLYVARNRIEWDADGNAVSWQEKVDDAEVCVGQVLWHYDPDAYPDPGWNVTTTTCDQLFTGETTVMAYTRPEWPTGAFDGPIGVAAGVTKVPDEPGSYSLVAEPLDETFRRGDSWRLDQDWWQTWNNQLRGTYRKRFDVGGGVYLDETFFPISDIHMLVSAQSLYYRFSMTDGGEETVVDIEAFQDGGSLGQYSVDATRVGMMQDGSSLYHARLQVSVPDLPGENELDPSVPVLVSPGGLIELQARPPSQVGLKQAAPAGTAFVGTPTLEFIELGSVVRFGLNRECSAGSPGVARCVYEIEPTTCPVDQVCPPGAIPTGGDLVDPNDVTWRLETLDGASPDNRAFHLHVFDDGGTAIEGAVFAERVTDSAVAYATGLSQVLTGTRATDRVLPCLLQSRPREYLRDAAVCTAPNDCWHTATSTFGGSTTPIDVDDEINRVASQMAFSPEVLKAQVFQESYAGGRFDPNVVRYEPLTADFRYFTGEFEEPVDYDPVASAMFTLPGDRLSDSQVPPESSPPRESRGISASVSSSSLDLPGCGGCSFKVFFGNPGGIPGNCARDGGFACDGGDPIVSPVSGSSDPNFEMEFEVWFNGTEVPAYFEQVWQAYEPSGVPPTRTWTFVTHSVPGTIPTGHAVINPTSGDVTYHGPVVPGDTLELNYDAISDIRVTSRYPLGSLVESTGILDSINQALNARPYWYPSAIGYGLTFSDLHGLWYPVVTNPRTAISGNDSEKMWLLDLNGAPVDPKFDVESQFIWGQAMGATQFQVHQFVTTDWGHGLQVMVDEHDVVVFDLFNPNRSLTSILRDFDVNLRLLLEVHLSKGLYGDYPCVDGASGYRCTDAEWQLFVSDALRLYNGTARGLSSDYPSDVYVHLVSPASNDGAFGGNVQYADPIP